MLRHALTLQKVAQRSICTSACRQVKNRVPERQKEFQEDLGLPVHLQGGTRDYLLYGATMVLAGCGTGAVLYELWKASFPQKKN
ncbi:cytochrome c oxidase subunit 7A2b [Cynoglossus semilaevis]|uniref:Cytochrome c oxidase subunit 7A2, mitochondrial n=1 Tax=Cynoglossus semilaevis TaxID=244447 RepID=A0A3P8UZH8_CYNSE|nr:cytochrome c oxidase subunit 7A2, mitochondrial [Cynoglossus semilaevis]